jgi:hypothetical protein
MNESKRTSSELVHNANSSQWAGVLTTTRNMDRGMSMWTRKEKIELKRQPKQFQNPHRDSSGMIPLLLLEPPRASQSSHCLALIETTRSS